jgi:hypothetical protein
MVNFGSECVKLVLVDPLAVVYVNRHLEWLHIFLLTVSY